MYNRAGIEDGLRDRAELLFSDCNRRWLFIAHIQVRAGTAVLDEREVYVVVPARPVILF